MAYNSGERFSLPPKSYNLLDPGAYQKETSNIKQNKAPFLSKSTRNTQPGVRVWTQAIYHADLPPKIPNCTAMMSKRPRFPYEAFSKEDLEEILCKCGVQNVCECLSEEIKPEIICQNKVRRRLFKGHPPRAHLHDVSENKIGTKGPAESPPFYDARVDESTAFYQGCKWSRWTSKRSSKEQEQSPGPADYTLEREQTLEELCAEKTRAEKRKNSKQLRFIEEIQQRNILEGRPGPATYSPNIPTYSNLQFLGPRAERFPVSSDQRPGPADHWIQRDFDLPIPPLYPCQARLPEPPFFGIKAQRFKPLKEEGPSPATYSVSHKECLFMHCPTAPFGSSSQRFKQEVIEEDEEVELVAEDEPLKKKSLKLNRCPTPTWGFKSKTIRMKPLEKKWREPSPADLPQSNLKVERLRQLQYNAPFFSSGGRFQPWNDWTPVFGRYETPGPCYYELEKPKCYPAVCRGPLVRSRRFSSTSHCTPGPNEYNVGGGVESVLDTHNQKLQSNMYKQHLFHWEPPIDAAKLSFEEQETYILDKSIALLDTVTDINDSKATANRKDVMTEKPKILRYFLYSHQIPKCT